MNGAAGCYCNGPKIQVVICKFLYFYFMEIKVHVSKCGTKGY